MLRLRPRSIVVVLAVTSTALAACTCVSLAATKRGAAAFTPLPAEQEYAQALALANVASGRLYEVGDHDFAVLPDGRFLLVTSRYALVRGYRGPTVLSIVLDANGTVAQVSLLRSADTKKFVDRLRRKLPQLLGQSLSAKDRRPLAVTGATKTTTGVNATVEQALAAFARVFPRLAVDAENCRYRGKMLTPKDIVAKSPQ